MADPRRADLLGMLELDDWLDNNAIPDGRALSTGTFTGVAGRQTGRMDDPHLVVAEYSYGLEASTATFHDGPQAALEEAGWLQGQCADDTVTYRAFALVEVRRGFVPTNEVMPWADH